MHRAALAALVLSLVIAGCHSVPIERQEIGAYVHPGRCGAARTYPYLVYTPPGFHEPENQDRRWPLLLYLPGMLTFGDDVRRIPEDDPPYWIERGRDFPMVVLSAMPPTFLERWSPDVVISLVDLAIREYRVDPDRVVLTGSSVGGAGAWDTAIRHPERIAAIVPVAAWGHPAGVERMAGVAVWAFHGALDFAIPPAFHERMVHAHRAAGGTARFTCVPWKAHWVWEDAYCRDDLYAWILEQRRRPSGRPM